MSERGAPEYAGKAVEVVAKTRRQALESYGPSELAQLSADLGTDERSVAKYGKLFEENALDGWVFLEITDFNDYAEIGVDRKHAVALCAVAKGILGDFGQPTPQAQGSTPPQRVGGGGFVKLAPSEEAALRAADVLADKKGVGAVYGQLVVLGYKEYRVEGSTWHPVGGRNEKFELKRRKKANGIRRSRAYVVGANQPHQHQQHQQHQHPREKPGPGGVGDNAGGGGRGARGGDLLLDDDVDVDDAAAAAGSGAGARRTKSSSSSPPEKNNNSKGHESPPSRGGGGQGHHQHQHPLPSSAPQKRSQEASHSVTMSIASKDGRMQSSRVTVEYVPDAREDMFQLGRMIVPQNDFVVRGPLHLDSGGVLCGPVSRYACRLACSRLPPYECKLFAAGFNNEKDIFLSEMAPKWQLQPGEVAADDLDNLPGAGERQGRKTKQQHDALQDDDDDDDDDALEEDDDAFVVDDDDDDDDEEDSFVVDEASDADQNCSSQRPEESEASTGGGAFGVPPRARARARAGAAAKKKKKKKKKKSPSTTSARSHLDETTAQWDALTTFGVRIWKPEIGHWREVSVHGGIHEPRKQPESAGRRYPNENSTLTNGTIVDLAGIQLLFESAESMREHDRNERLPGPLGDEASAPDRIVARFNARRPQCPVQLHTIRLEYDDAKRKALAKDRTPYIFPACGHVHAFAQELRGAPCPLCRSRGPFVELKLEWEPAICDEEPEVAFNPCGHIVSERVARKWASLALPDNAPPNARYRPICPFCAKPLKTDTRNGDQPFTKILFQSQGPGGDDDDDDNSNDDASFTTDVTTAVDDPV